MRWAQFLFVTLVVQPHAAGQLPKVERDFTGPARVDCIGKTLAEIIPPGSVARLILSHNRGVDTPRPGAKHVYHSDELIAQFFKSPAKAEPHGSLGTDGVLAEFLILTKDGELYRLEVLSELGIGPVTGGLLYGKGLMCRFTVKLPTDKAQKK